MASPHILMSFARSMDGTRLEFMQELCKAIEAFLPHFYDYVMMQRGIKVFELRAFAPPYHTHHAPLAPRCARASSAAVHTPHPPPMLPCK